MEKTNDIYRLNRNTSIELLRILALIMIVFYHMSIYSNVNLLSDGISINKLFFQFIQCCGKVGSNIFILISGFFCVKKSTFKLSKLLQLWCEVFFYSVILYVVFNYNNLFSLNLIDALAPISSGMWWFMSCYFIIFLISPFLKKMLEKLSKKEFQRLLYILSFLWIVIPTFSLYSMQLNNFLWLLFIFIIGIYIGIYDIKISKKANLIAIISVFAFYLLFVLGFDILGIKVNSVFSQHATYMFGQNYIPTVLLSVSLFILFKNLNMKTNKHINLISTSTLGVYLIHDNPYFRNYIWGNVFIKEFYTSEYFILYVIGFAFSLFIILSLIDIIRNVLFKHTISRVIDNLRISNIDIEK